MTNQQFHIRLHIVDGVYNCVGVACDRVIRINSNHNFSRLGRRLWKVYGGQAVYPEHNQCSQRSRRCDPAKCCRYRSINQIHQPDSLATGARAYKGPHVIARGLFGHTGQSPIQLHLLTKRRSALRTFLQMSLYPLMLRSTQQISAVLQ